MQFGIVTLFPQMMQALDNSIPGRAIANGLIRLQCWNPRDYTEDKHRAVDDRPYGGGPGMVMSVQPLYDAVQAAKQAMGQTTKVILLSPQGRCLTQPAAQALVQQPGLILVCGRYEGVDERFIELAVDEEWSIGDYVLSGGELAAMVMIDVLTRLIPGSLGDMASAEQDSFMQGLLDCPHYTRPEHYQNLTVPKVLLSGNHQAITEWREQQALLRTWLRRPDLLASLNLTREQQQRLDELIELQPLGEQHEQDH